MRRATLILVALLAASGCSGSGGEPAASSRTASPATSWRPGEFREPIRQCDAVSADLLRRLRVQPDSSSGGCFWRESARDDDDHVERTLSLYNQVYAPGYPRPGLSATDEARSAFRHPQGWEKLAPGVPVRGLGDEAKLARKYYPGIKRRQVLLAVRLRNDLIQIELSEQSLLERNGARIPPMAEVEAAALTAARDVLTRLGSPPTAAAAAPAYGSGEVRRVRGICDSVDVASRLVPGGRRRDTSPADSELGSGCDWSENEDKRPQLTIEAEVITPSAATGETASQIAMTLFRQWRHKGPRPPTLGDEAAMDHYSFESGLSRDSTIYIRRGNLLLYVRHGRWNYPSQATLDKEIINIARKILSAH